MTNLPQSLREQVSIWLAQDPDPATVIALERLRRAAGAGDPSALSELTAAFQGRLEFGTAGLRGPMGPGPARMNRVVVGQAAAGLAAYLKGQGHSDRRVIVGYDARHNSDVFARDTAEILAGAGLRPLLCRHPLPTPVVAFGIKHFDCVAGVVVTASHNPAQDNGYKVYLADGSQIIPPADAAISAHIDDIAHRPFAAIVRSTNYPLIDDELTDAYAARAASLIPDRAVAAGRRTLRWVYTAFHGVGAAMMARVAQSVGFLPAITVEAQIRPDPAFPTLPFPNPEEPGAIDMALTLARHENVDLVIAHDPDADRCAVAAVIDDHWRMLTGDELGALLADDALRRGVQGTFACSIVSGTQLAEIAAAYGQPFAVTLTGFKWIGRVPELAFGYEEAIGYCTDPTAVPDKDGITTAVRVLNLAAELAAQGSSIAKRLDEIAARFGVQLTDHLALRTDDPATIARIMSRLRAHPPAQLVGQNAECIDYSLGWSSLPATEALAFVGTSTRVVVRPSGTEPKLKCYLQVTRPPSEDLATARTDAEAELVRLRDEVHNFLQLPALDGGGADSSPAEVLTANRDR